MTFRSAQVHFGAFDRACRLYFAATKAKGKIVNQPSEASSGEETHHGNSYYVLRNINGALACFKIGNDGRLALLPDFDLKQLDVR